ncbi:MAG: hypothetical protein JNK69_05900 [Saprospiraceae bacterium]|nr:hypothetical protein [Candidatus Vicinibacter proximus]MBL7822920.1 hypothetical protein [Saprospiraceae bacterium]
MIAISINELKSELPYFEIDSSNFPSYQNGNVYFNVLRFIEENEYLFLEDGKLNYNYFIFLSLMFGLLENFEAAKIFLRIAKKGISASEFIHPFNYFMEELSYYQDLTRENYLIGSKRNCRVFYYSASDLQVDKLWLYTNYINYSNEKVSINFEFISAIGVFKNIPISRFSEVFVILYAHSASKVDGELLYLKVNGKNIPIDEVVSELTVNVNGKYKCVMLYNCGSNESKIYNLFKNHFEYVVTSADLFEVENLMLYNYLFFSYYRLNGCVKKSNEIAMFYTNSLFSVKSIFDMKISYKNGIVSTSENKGLLRLILK